MAQGKADLNTAIANQKLSAVTAKRWDALLAQGAVARQDADAKDSDLAAKNAMVASARANLAHLEAMECFKRLVAPFDGIVTTRSVDVGRLVLVGTPGRHAALHHRRPEARLRIYVRVPQTEAGCGPARHDGHLHRAGISGPQLHRHLWRPAPARSPAPAAPSFCNSRPTMQKA